MSSAGALTVAQLSVSLDGRSIVQPVDFTLPVGQLVAIVGPNGAGKTTLLRALAGLVPAAGEVNLGGTDLATLDAAQRAKLMSYLPQGHQAHWPLPARDLVALGRYPHGARDPTRLPEADRRIVDEAMRRSDTTSFADRPVQGLSGGERARVMLARVLAVEAPVMLADEPTAALDPRHQLGIIASLVAEAARGALVIAVTHDLLLAARFAVRVLVMHQGRLVAEGPPAATLTPDLLLQVYGVEAREISVDGSHLTLPWSVA